MPGQASEEVSWRCPEHWVVTSPIAGGFCCGCGKALAQVAQGSCGITIPGASQKLYGHGPGQPAVVALLEQGGAGPDGLLRSLPSFTIW